MTRIPTKKAKKYYRVCSRQRLDIDYLWFFEELENYFGNLGMKVEEGLEKDFGYEYKYINIYI